MDRRNFMKYLGGTGLAMMCDSAVGSNLTAGVTNKLQKEEQELFKDSLHFKKDGSFKIVQFTDIHYRTTDKLNSSPSLDNMNEILNSEKPDFIIYTGDLVYSKGTYEALDIILNLAIKRNIPYAVVWGNHDDEYDHNRQELYDYVQKKKGAVMPIRTTNDVPDFIIPIKSHNSETIKSLLYCIDSHAYSKVREIGGYDWIYADQINWYRDVSKKFTEYNSGEPMPSLAFFHIPIPEFKDAVQGQRNRMFGVRGEGICSPKINSKFFNAVEDCKDIMGIFVGHDHDNDYAVMYKNVMLAYGRYSGGNTVYNDIENGARIIEMHEGERKFNTHIRLNKKVVESRVTYPDSFVLKNFNKVKEA